MLSELHRAVASTLAEVDVPALDDRSRAEVATFVDGQLRALPTHLALGVRAVATLLVVAVVARRGRPFGSLHPARRRAIVERWGASALPPVRLYVRLIRSLVVYGGHELEPDAA